MDNGSLSKTPSGIFKTAGSLKIRTGPQRERSDTPDPCRGFIGELKDSHGTTATAIRPRPIPVEDPKEDQQDHASFGSLEHAQRATSAGFSIKMLKRLLLQPRNRRPRLQHQSRDPQGLIPQLPSQEEEAQDQSREGNPTSLQLAPLRQRPREDLRAILRILGRLILRVEG